VSTLPAGTGGPRVSSMLVDLAARALARAGLPTGGTRPPGGDVDPCLSALRPAADLRGAVARLWHGPGAAAVFGLGLRQAELPFSPALHLLDTSGSVEALARRWRTMELAWGIRNLTCFAPDGVRAVRLDFLPDRGVPAAASQNLVICGAVAGLLRAQGFGGLHLSARSDGRWGDVADGARWLPPGRLDADAFRLAWTGEPSAWTPRLHLLGNTPAAGAPAGPRDGDPVARVAELAARDPSRYRTPADLARAVAWSPRTLDRRMAAHGTSAGRVLRRARLRAACVAFASSSRSLTDIAHETGFSDAAHLSRTFRAAAGMTPTTYRRAVAVG